MPHVTVSIATSWNINKRIVATPLQAIWNVQSRIRTTRQTSWNIQLHLIVPRQVLWVVDDVTPGVTTNPCKPWLASANPFSRVYIDHLIVGNSRVYWEMATRFNDPLPWTFQLQFSEVGTPTASDWLNIGQPVVNTFYAVDTQRRLFGKELKTNYRIRLTTSRGTYFSPAQSVFGKLNKHDWLMGREITRKELLRLQKYTAVQGYLLIAKRSGTVCSCVDPLTGEVTNSNDTTCYGVGYVGGYYDPFPCTFFDLTTDQRSEALDLQARGMIDDQLREGRFIGYPTISVRDVFVDRDSDERYYFKKIQIKAAIRDVPIIVSPALLLAPYTDVIYSFPVSR